MKRLHDKYGRGSAAANGEGFVDLEPGDTFSGLEAQLRLVQSVVYENQTLNLKASISSRRNANSGGFKFQVVGCRWQGERFWRGENLVARFSSCENNNLI